MQVQNRTLPKGNNKRRKKIKLDFMAHDDLKFFFCVLCFDFAYLSIQTSTYVRR